MHARTLTAALLAALAFIACGDSGSSPSDKELTEAYGGDAADAGTLRELFEAVGDVPRIDIEITGELSKDIPDAANRNWPTST